MIARIARSTAISCAAFAVLLAIVSRSIEAGVAVLGGGLLIGFSFWAIAGAVDELMPSAGGLSRRSPDRAKSDLSRRKVPPKFFVTPVCSMSGC